VIVGNRAWYPEDATIDYENIGGANQQLSEDGERLS
jgi:hypothetical protein